MGFQKTKECRKKKNRLCGSILTNVVYAISKVNVMFWGGQKGPLDRQYC